MSAIKTKRPTKTVYWDAKDGRFMCIVWDGERARHHKIPKTVLTEAEAKKIVKPLGMEYHDFG